MPKKPKRNKASGLSLIAIILAIFSLIVLAAVFFSSQNYCANSRTCIADLSGNYNPDTNAGEFHGEKVYAPSGMTAHTGETNILGETDSANKRIEIDLTNQKLYAFEENKVIYEFPISSGKWGQTPTGDFRVWVKLRYTRMSGGSRALGTYYNLPNVPYTMFFYGNGIPKSRGYGIHGAYWHNNFGNPMSHGCINMRIEDAEKIYHWATPYSDANTTYATSEDPGTPIRIYGTAPNT